MIERFLIIISSIGLMSCQSSATFQSPLNTHDYGPAPIIDEAEVKLSVGQSLKDEESARYKLGEPQKAYCNSGLLSGGKVIWTGWALQFQVNAKNSYGAYTGFENMFAR